jgi:hypothetical protein
VGFQITFGNLACILTLRMENHTHTKKYGDIVQVHQHEFNSQFQDFGKNQATIGFLSSFVINIENVPHELI